MRDKTSLESLSGEIRRIYRENPSEGAEGMIEEILGGATRGLPLEEKEALVERLIQAFSNEEPPLYLRRDPGSVRLSELFSLLLGKRIEDTDCSTEEIVERLAGSLNTVFDSLNELVGGISATLLGRTSGTETIRYFIGSRLEQEKATENKSLEDYLARIKEAFSIGHQAYKDAAYTKMKEILRELSPKALEEAVGSGLRFGPLRKAAMFETYEEKHRTLENWLESGLLLDALLREFERICQKLYSEKGGRR